MFIVYMNLIRVAGSGMYLGVGFDYSSCQRTPGTTVFPFFDILHLCCKGELLIQTKKDQLYELLYDTMLQLRVYLN